MRTKFLWVVTIFLMLLMNSCNSKIIFEDRAGDLSLKIDGTGKIVSLLDVNKGVDYIANQPSFLMKCSRYGNNDKLEVPLSAKCVSANLLELTYPDNIKLTVSVEPNDKYFRMELVKVDPVAKVSQIQWGPYYTNAKSFIGEWFGIVRSDDFTIGLMSLEPNTDGASSLSSIAKYTEEGASLQLVSFDHTRGVYRDFKNGGVENKLRCSKPIDVTVKGSAVALYSSRPGYDNELDAVENVVLKEGLPHPTIDGVWSKRSRKQTKTCLWTRSFQNNYKGYVDLAEAMDASILCLYGGFSKNWGHFDIDEKKFPGGTSEIRQMSKDAQAKGIGTTLYTLTTFTKPISADEPYLGPKPDDRLQTWRYTSVVNQDIKSGDKEIVIKNSPNIAETVKSTKHIRIENELITFKEYREDAENIVLSDCERGTFATSNEDHKKGEVVKFMFFSGFQNFYPGTIDMTIEESDNIFKIMKDTDQKMLVTDGFESCMETGYGCYAGNLFANNFYQKGKNNNMEFAWTSSNFSNYSWHHVSHISWGEFDLDKGIRGTMLDYRISRQVLLGTSLMPKKLGQYYPDNASVADIEWLMAFSTGWDSGIDFEMNLNSFKQNPNYKEIVRKMALWSEAREKKVFSEEQLMKLRQTDREYTLSKNEDGSWNLKFVKFWMNDKVKIRPSTDFPVKSLSQSPVKSCSIDWTWTHNPAPYYEVMLSDDLVHDKGCKETEWEVTYPKYVNPEGSWYPTDYRHFQFVLRVPKDAPCAVKDFVLSFNGYKIMIPVTLNPGEYLTMPQLIPNVCIYNSKHELLSEKMIRGDIPYIKTGDSAKILFSCTPVDQGKTPSVIMNVRCQNGYFFPNPIK